MQVWMLLGSGMISAASVAAGLPDDASQNERALREACSAASQAAMKECLSAEVARSLDSLKQAEEAMLAALDRWDEDDRYAHAARADLAASGRTFIRYRAAHCRMLASLSGGGAGQARSIRRQACEAELNLRRAGQLRRASGEIPPK